MAATTEPQPDDDRPQRVSGEVPTTRVVSTQGGDYAEGNIDKRQGVFVELHLTPDDNAAIRSAKIAQGRRIAVHDILVNIGHIDAWLTFVATALAPDQLDARIAVLRTQIAPATASESAAGYRALIAAQQVAALRQALNSRPIRRELSLAVVDLLAETGQAAEEMRFFVDQLAVVQDAAESLLGVLDSAARWRKDTDSAQRHLEDQRNLAYRNLRNRAQTAYIAGLRSLSALAMTPKDVQVPLDALQQLEPRRLLQPDELTQHLYDCSQEAEAIFQERAALVVQAEETLAQALEAYAGLEELLTIQPTDPWNVVVGKARSLRDLGRTTDAVAAFSRYADMFGTTDSGAAAYARVAQQFTLQLARFGVRGAVYIFDVLPRGAAAQAGLQTSDIVISYGEHTVTDMPELVAALQSSADGTLMRVTYLRIDEQSQFTQRTTTIAGGPPGAGFMPI